jgi:hypothetical protein
MGCVPARMTSDECGAVTGRFPAHTPRAGRVSRSDARAHAVNALPVAVATVVSRYLTNKLFARGRPQPAPPGMVTGPVALTLVSRACVLPFTAPSCACLPSPTRRAVAVSLSRYSLSESPLDAMDRVQPNLSGSP